MRMSFKTRIENFSDLVFQEKLKVQTAANTWHFFRHVASTVQATSTAKIASQKGRVTQVSASGFKKKRDAYDAAGSTSLCVRSTSVRRRVTLEQIVQAA